MTGNVTGNVSGNADTVTNGLYSTGSYSNPTWLTAVPYSILSGTVPTWNQDTTGNSATVTNGVYTNDARLTDSRIASDVYSWAKQATKPSYTQTEVGLGNVTNESKATMFTSPTFTGTVGGFDIGGNIIPTTTNTYNLGSATNMWHSMYVGPGSIYVDGQKVLQTDISDSVVVSSDVNQNLILKTSGTGNIELNPSGTGQILLKSDITLTGGKVFETSNSSAVIFSDGISSPSITTSVLNGGISITPNGSGNTYITTGSFGIGNTAPGALLDLGLAGTTGGVLRFAGLESGNVSLQPNAIAGTNIVLTLPATTGTVALTSQITGTNSGTNTGDNAVNTLYSGLVSNATHTGDATGSGALTVVALNGTNLATLGTGILKNTTGTGVPSIAVANDFPTLNQNTTGTAGGLSSTLSVTSGGTGLTGIAGLSLLVANSANTFVALTPGAGNSIRINAGGTAWEAYTPGVGGGSQTPWTSAINAAGYTLNGNSTASGNLTLDSTSHATKGYVLINPTGGNVGIGTTAPSGSLDIRGAYLDPTTGISGILNVRSTDSATIDKGGSISFGGFHNGSSNQSTWAAIKGAKENATVNNNASYLSFYTQTSGNLPTEQMRINSLGNVGIGTTSPSYILSLGGTSARTFGMNRNTTAGTAGLGLTITSGGAIAGTSDLVGGDLTLSSGIATGTGTSAIHFLTATAGASAVTDRTPTEKMTILGSGNVGIGTTAPTQALSFDGTGAHTIWMERNTTAATAGQGLTLSSGGSYSTGTDLAGGDLNLKSGTATGTGSSALRFFTATAGTTGSTDRTPTEKMIILGNGQTGLGMSPASAFIFSTNGAIWSAGENKANALQVSNGPDGYAFTRMGYVGTYGYLRASDNATHNIMLDANPSNYSWINSGNVGIGTTGPAATLDVRGQILGTANGNNIFVLNSTGSNFGLISNNATGVWSLGYGTTIATLGTPVLIWNASGNVGIGTTTPVSLLNISAASNATAYGTLTIEGSSNSNSNTGSLEIVGRRSDNNASSAFSGALYLSHLRTDQAMAPGVNDTFSQIGNIIFGGNHTDGTRANIAYAASIGALAESAFSNASTMPTSLIFRTGSTGSVEGSSNIQYGTEKMRITSSGNVGIGTTSPGTKLAVYGNGARITVRDDSIGTDGINLGTDTAGVGILQMYDSNAVERVRLYSNTAASSAEYWFMNGNVGIGTTSPSRLLTLQKNGDYQLRLVNGSTGGGSWAIGQADDSFASGGSKLVFVADDNVNNSSVARMVITNTGNVGIGTTSPGNLLTIKQTSATDPIADAWTTYSSGRWKENRVSIINALETINELNPIYFDWTAEYGGAHDLGFIAEEVGIIIPEIVAWEENGIDAKSIDYARLSTIAIAGIKEMNLKITNINDMEINNDWRDSITAWMANAENKITRIFTGEICLTDPGEEAVCINRTELQSLKALIGSSSGGDGGDGGDTTAPVIVLNGEALINVELNGVYTELEAIAEDDVDGDISAEIVIGGDVIDTATAGIYVITYNVADTAGNPADEVTREINVGEYVAPIVPSTDVVAPVITLNGASEVTLTVGDIYTETVTAEDDVDGDITADITTGGTFVDTATAGTYTITYNVSDTAGNNAEEVVRTIIVNEVVTPPPSS
jgi:hypothetical protein